MILWVFWLSAFGLVGLYLLRARRRRLVVPFLALFMGGAGAARAATQARRLRRPFSLLLQLAILALVAASLVSLLRREAHPEGTYAFVLDASATMKSRLETESPRTRFDDAVERLRRRIRAMGESESALLVELSERPRVLVPKTSDREALLQALEEVELVDAAPNWQALVELLRIESHEARGLRAIVATDGSGQPAADWSSSHRDELPPFRLEIEEIAPGASSEANLAIRAFAARRYPNGNGDFEVAYEITHTPPREELVRLTLYRVDVDGKKRMPLNVEQLRLDAEPTYRGVLEDLSGAFDALELEIERESGPLDLYRSDDIRRATLPPLKPVRVLLVGSQDLFLRAALLADPRIEFHEIDGSAYPPRDQAFDLTIFQGIAPERSANAGPALYLGADGPHVPISRGRELKLFGFDEWDTESKIFRHFDPYDAEVLRGFSLEPQAGDRVLGRSGRFPIFVSGQRAEGAFLALGFRPDASDIVLRPAFPLFLRGILDELVGLARADWLEARVAGTLAQLELGANAPELVKFEGPLGEGTRERTFPVVGGVVSYSLERAGFYRVHAASWEGSALIAVNVSPARAFSSVPKDERVLSRAPPPVAPPPRTWIVLLALAFVLSLFEFFGFHKRWTV